MDLRHLRSFAAPAGDLHFGRAARRSGMVQSALSAQIRALEAEVGAPPFARTSRAVALSPIGAAFHADAVAILASTDRAMATARAAAAGRTGQVAIGFAGAAAFADLPPKDLAAFKATRPGVAPTVTEMSTPAQPIRWSRRSPHR